MLDSAQGHYGEGLDWGEPELIDLNLEILYGDQQWESLNWDPRGDFYDLTGRLPIEVLAILGDYGGGKTFNLMACAVARWLMNPYDPEYHTGKAPPMSGICAPTLSDVMAGAYVELHKILPDDMILEERLYHPWYDIRIFNGHRVKIYTGKAACNGPTLCTFTATEIQDRLYANIMRNIQMRCRDGRAADMYRDDARRGVPPEERRGRLSFSVDGLPEVGHVEDVFRDDAGMDRKTIMIPTGANEGVGLAEGVTEQAMRSLPASFHRRDKDGWLKRSGVIWPCFSSANLVPMATLREKYGVKESRRTHVGIDFRSQAAVVFGQRIQTWCEYGGAFKDGNEDALAIVDQWMPDNQTAERMAETLAAKCEWNIEERGCVFTYDPTASDDEVGHFKRCFPNASHRRFGKKTRLYAVGAGETVVDWAIEDYFGNARLLYADELRSDPSKRGVVAAARNWDGRDGNLEHAADAKRYLVQTHLKPPKLVRKRKAHPGGVLPSTLTPGVISRSDGLDLGGW